MPARQPITVPKLVDAHRLVDEHIRSGRYDADVAQVVSAARAWMEERAKIAAKPAIVLDIDETSLSNWPAYRINGWGRVVNGGWDLDQALAGCAPGRRSVNRRRFPRP